jgi:hypothetical protein
VEHPYPLIEFETECGDDGVIRVPRLLMKNLTGGGRVTVRLTNGDVSPVLRKRRVSEEEIETIAIRQLERRENVVGFLKAEGELSTRRSFGRRAASLLKK